MRRIKNELNDAKEELNWWRGYAGSLEGAIEEMQDLISESRGIVGYHLNDAVALWDELIIDSKFEFALKDIQNKRNFTERLTRVTSEARKELYIKTYEGMPITVHYTPIYGGIKYIRSKEEAKK